MQSPDHGFKQNSGEDVGDFTKQVLSAYREDIIDITQPIALESADNLGTEVSVEDAMVVNMQEARDICTSYSIPTHLDALATPVTQFLNDIAERVFDDQIQKFYDAHNAPAQVTTSEEVFTA
eukprot:IDg15660t1